MKTNNESTITNGHLVVGDCVRKVYCTGDVSEIIGWIVEVPTPGMIRVKWATGKISIELTGHVVEA
jgi:hypothetical protein